MSTPHKTIVVTGGSTGIGLCICLSLLDAGYKVINLSRRKAEIDRESFSNMQVDLSSRDETSEAAEKIAAKHEVTGFVHNAGLIRPALLGDVQLNDFDYLAQVHIGTAISLTQAFLPKMKKNNFGRIVLITSRAALGLQTRTSYATTKSGMMGMARTWALELGEFGITVNTVAPGPIEATEMFHEVMPEGDPKIDSLAASIPVKRVGRPDDVARAVLFFNDPQNSFVTGQTLMVCGGASLGSLSL